MAAGDKLGLGPLETIVNVGWSGPNIGVLTFSLSMHTRSFPVLTLTDLLTGTAFDIFTGQHQIGGTATVVNPISDAMRRLLYVWTTVPQKVGPGSDHICTGKALIFFNFGPLIALARASNPDATSLILGRITTPAGTVESHEDTFYWLWDSTFGASSLEDNQDNPFTTGDPFNNPFGTMTVPRAFGTSADRDAYLALGNPFWHGAETVETTNTNTALQWETTLTSWGRKVNFPTVSGQSATLAPAGLDASGNEILRERKTESANQSGNPSLAAATLTYTLTFRELRVAISR